MISHFKGSRPWGFPPWTITYYTPRGFRGARILIDCRTVGFYRWTVKRIKRSIYCIRCIFDHPAFLHKTGQNGRFYTCYRSPTFLYRSPSQVLYFDCGCGKIFGHLRWPFLQLYHKAWTCQAKISTSQNLHNFGRKRPILLLYHKGRKWSIAILKNSQNLHNFFDPPWHDTKVPRQIQDPSQSLHICGRPFYFT